MDKRNRVMLGLILLVLTTLSCGIFSSETDSSNQNDWEKYTSNNGQYSILFPSTPTEDTVTHNSDYGQITTYITKTADNDFGYVVTYTDEPIEYINNNSKSVLLDNFRDQSIKNSQGNLLSEKIISLQNYSGRELKVEYPNNIIVVMRVYLVGDRFYSIAISTTEDNIYDNNVKFFLDSFTLE